MENNTLTSAGSALIGAGLAIVVNDLIKGFILLGAGVVLLVGVALLQKFGVPVSARIG